MTSAGSAMTTAALAFGPADPRVRRLNEKPVNPKGDLVLYWMQIHRRADDNAALAYAILRANELGLPCVVYEAIRPDYPHASDRLHAFALEGVEDTAARLAARGIAYAFFLPRTRDEARGVVAKLTARAALVVSDDYPSFVIPAHNEAAAARAPCAYVVVDDNAIVPLSLVTKQEIGARTLRPKVNRLLEAWLLPLEEPSPKVSPPARLDLPFDATKAPAAPGSDIDALVAGCAIDHDVPRVESIRGGSREADARLDRFVRRTLSSYGEGRNDPSRDGTSGLSPYLHWGMISARKIALAAQAEVRDPKDPEDSASAFLEQLVVRRALSFNFARAEPLHASYAALPAWAKATLESHANDAEKHLVSEAELEAGRSGDELWDAAQGELRARGLVHGYARMLWGKLPLAWLREPKDAHAFVVRMNDKWALDGRDPSGYANVSWCFGLHDRPWPERPIFGKVRSMTSRSARRKLDFEGYIETYRRG